MEVMLRRWYLLKTQCEGYSSLPKSIVEYAWREVTSEGGVHSFFNGRVTGLE